ncbi:MAG: hypothetical protein HYY44_04605 [Deltaproteobacteria bacterium]|nr:hypothetical protein [Deltaproteobacteria bacterium]
MTSKKLIFSFVLVLFAFSPSLVFGQATSTVPPSHPALFRGVRPLGMGNAFVAMPGSDENAVYYNPAAIHDYEPGLDFVLVSPTIDFTTESIALVQDVVDLAGDLNDQEGDITGQIDTFQNFVDLHTGQFHSIDVRLPILMVLNRHVTIGTLADSRTTISFRNRTFSNFELSSRSDVGGHIGGAYGFFEDQLNVGVNVKVLHRVSIDQVLTIDDIFATDDFKDAMPIERATGVGVDLGLMGKVPTFDLKPLEILKPTIGFTWQDIADTRFAGDVPDTQQSISLGAALHPGFHLGNYEFKNHLEVDFRELNQPVSFSKKLYFGYEFMFPRFLHFFQPSFRLGMHQLYFAAGGSIDLRLLKLEVATYGEEVGRFTRQQQSRRIAGNITFQF